LYHV
jgi:transposase InsO family protein